MRAPNSITAATGPDAAANQQHCVRQGRAQISGHTASSDFSSPSRVLPVIHQPRVTQQRSGCTSSYVFSPGARTSYFRFQWPAPHSVAFSSFLCELARPLWLCCEESDLPAAAVFPRARALASRAHSCGRKLARSPPRQEFLPAHTRPTCAARVHSPSAPTISASACADTPAPPRRSPAGRRTRARNSPCRNAPALTPARSPSS